MASVKDAPTLLSSPMLAMPGADAVAEGTDAAAMTTYGAATTIEVGDGGQGDGLKLMRAARHHRPHPHHHSLTPLITHHRPFLLGSGVSLKTNVAIKNGWIGKGFHIHRSLLGAS